MVGGNGSSSARELVARSRRLPANVLPASRFRVHDVGASPWRLACPDQRL